MQYFLANIGLSYHNVLRRRLTENFIVKCLKREATPNGQSTFLDISLKAVYFA